MRQAVSYVWMDGYVYASRDYARNQITRRCLHTEACCAIQTSVSGNKRGLSVCRTLPEPDTA